MSIGKESKRPSQAYTHVLVGHHHVDWTAKGIATIHSSIIRLQTWRLDCVFIHGMHSDTG